MRHRARWMVALLTAPAAYWAAVAGPAFAGESLCTDDAILVLDASGSMVQHDRAGTTLIDGARSAARAIVPDAARSRKLGLMTLGPGSGDQCSNVELKVPVQENAAAPILDQIDKIASDGGTPLSKAVEAAADALDYTRKPAVVVVLSDGDETCGRDPCELAQRLKAKARDLTIHVIGFNASNGERAGAQCLASATRGRDVTVETTSELASALRQTLACPQVSSAAPHRGDYGKY